jgi:hypothetical protein
MMNAEVHHPINTVTYLECARKLACALVRRSWLRREEMREKQALRYENGGKLPYSKWA